MDQKPAEQEKKKELSRGTKIVGVVAIVLILLMAILLPIKLVPNAVSSVRSFISELFRTQPKNTANNTQATSTQVVPAPHQESPAPAPQPQPSQPTTPIIEPVQPAPEPEPAEIKIADLDISIIATGYLTSNNVFVPSDTLYKNLRAAIKFDVRNIGTKNSGSWKFKATLPSRTNPSFTSITQQSLAPDAHIEYVLGFQNFTTAQDLIATITVDPANTVSESSEENNILTAHFTQPE